MKYISTRTPQKRYSLREAAFLGLAPDGGLFMPERFPAIVPETVRELSAESYQALAVHLAGLFFGDELAPQEIARALDRAYDFAPRLAAVGDRLHTLELFHGPTFAFKDFGARFMGAMFGLLNDTGRERVILTATSGDTGSAVAGGFYGIPGIKVVLLYPAGRVSPLQESQMTTLGGNIFPLRVEGSFDDCQRMVKTVFADGGFCRQRGITSANSINLLRWIPQSFYYFYGWYLWREATGSTEPPVIVVPSGNYGNLSAGMLAARMGLPVGRFVAASNANDVVPEFLRMGDYRPRPSVRTVANAMDVGDPSNFERMMALCDADVDRLRSVVAGFSASDDRIREAIAEMRREYGYLSDPHSAVGYLAMQACGGSGGFWLSTAHEAKFREVLREALPADAIPAELPPALAERLSLPRKYEPLAADAGLLKEYLTTL
ncbi:threonine synthase [uncultured Rikenella sp.]|uniref:threonine synthase n=1 Tax=uncultured Rikenella sp. TaxID=368003 RepID=UPI002627CF93|nr:threonine synthase [uncultured Rikenella sp.]